MTDMRHPQANETAENDDDEDEYPEDAAELMAELLRYQSIKLHYMFADLFKAGGENLDRAPLRGERLTWLALRAQSNCRSALVAMTRASDAVKRAREAQGVADPAP